MKRFDLIVFDIDGTLTESKVSIDQEMSHLLSRLITKYKVAIISGANFEQFKWQILDHLVPLTEKRENLILLPVDGTIYCNYEEGWKCQSDKPFPEEEKRAIKSAFVNLFQESGLEVPNKTYGELLEDRGAQFNFSALGQQAPIELKEKWDPDGTKRKKMISVLAPKLEGYSFRIGGTTSIEVTKKGIDKAYGLNKLMNLTGISKESIFYIGDKFLKGGNDEPVKLLGMEYKEVGGVEETKVVIGGLLGS